MRGRGQKSAGRGGAKERVNRLIQKFDKCAYIVMEIFVVYNDVLINENIIYSILFDYDSSRLTFLRKVKVSL